MSFSPLDGLPMGTRCGRLDAAVVLHLIRQQGRSAADVSRLLFRESGLLGLSGVSSDMRELEASSLASAAMAVDYQQRRQRGESVCGADERGSGDRSAHGALCVG